VEELLFLAHRIPYPPNKGDKIRSWNILKYLSERYRVRLGCLIDDPHDRQYIPELERHCAEVVAVPISPRAQRLRSIFGLRPGMPLSAAYFRTRELSNWVASAIEANRIGRAFVFSTPMMGSLPQRHGMRVVLDMVDVDSEKWRVMAHKAPFPQRLIYAREGRTLLAYERTAAAAAAKVLLCTKEELALFLTRAPEATGKAGWMANGVDTAYFSPDHAFANPLPGDRPLIVFTGDMSYWPNVDAVAWFARLVLPSLLARWPRPLFLIVGARPTEAVRKLAGPDIVVTGRVDDVRPYVANAAVVVAPLLLARGVQNKVLEGLAMGKVVVATSAAEEGIGVRQDGALLIADEPSEMARLVGETLDGVHGSIGLKARELAVARFSWAATLSGLDGLFDAIDNEDRRETG